MSLIVAEAPSLSITLYVVPTVWLSQGGNPLPPAHDVRFAFLRHPSFGANAQAKSKPRHQFQP